MNDAIFIDDGFRPKTLSSGRTLKLCKMTAANPSRLFAAAQVLEIPRRFLHWQDEMPYFLVTAPQRKRAGRMGCELMTCLQYRLVSENLYRDPSVQGAWKSAILGEIALGDLRGPRRSRGKDTRGAWT